MRYCSPKLLTKKIILVDGISRAGKLLAGSLISSFHNSEHLEFGENFEHFCPALTFNKVDLNYARSYIFNYLNQTIYNKYLSRNVNFRPTDRTGVPNSINLNNYIKRLKSKEGDEIIKLIKKENKQIPFITHDLLVNINSLNDLGINYKMIQIFRNPVDLVMSWFKRGLGNRYGRDQRIFTLMINKNDKVYPWYNEILNFNKNLNELEKCINYVYSLTKKSLLNYKKLKKNEKKKVFITSYEKITQDTEVEIKKISIFLNLKISNHTTKFINKEKCPKKFDQNKLNRNRLYIKSKVKKIYYDKLISLEKSFNQNTYNLFN